MFNMDDFNLAMGKIRENIWERPAETGHRAR